MSVCVNCGAPILWVHDPDGRRFALDAHEVTVGPDRFALIDGKPVPVSATAQVLAHPDHRLSCRAPVAA